MKKCVAVLVLCLCLSACSAPAEEHAGDGLLGRAAALSEAEIILKIDGREVPTWRYLYWLAFTCDQIRDSYQAAKATLDWDAPLSGGTLADYAKDQALADTALYATVENWADKYGEALTDQDRQAAGAAWEKLAEEHGGEEAYLAELAPLGLDRERAETLALVGTLYTKLTDLAAKPDSPLAPEDGSLETFASQSGKVTVDRILVAAGEDREAARQQAAALFTQLNGAPDQADLFTQLAQAGDDPAGPRTIQPGDGTLPVELENAAQALEVGQCSGILESDEGFSILRRLAVDAGSLAEEYFDTLLQQGAEKAAVETTSAYEELDPAAFYKRLETLRAENQEREP